MADARLYIGNRTLGLACRFYARHGDAYSIGSHEGIVELLQRVAEELCTDDEFLIVQENQIGERTGNSLWKIKMDMLDPEQVPKSELDDAKTAYEAIKKDATALHNTCVSLGRQLKDAQDAAIEGDALRNKIATLEKQLIAAIDLANS